MLVNINPIQLSVANQHCWHCIVYQAGFQNYSWNSLSHWSGLRGLWGRAISNQNWKPILAKTPVITLCQKHYEGLIQHYFCPICGLYCNGRSFVRCAAKHRCHQHCLQGFISLKIMIPKLKLLFRVWYESMSTLWTGTNRKCPTQTSKNWRKN